MDDRAVETLVPGLQLERRYGGRMLIFTLTASISREMAEAWYRALRSYVESRETTDRFLVYDTSPLSFPGFNAYLRQRLLDVATAYPDATGRVALIIPQLGVIRPLAEYFIRRNNNRLQPKLDIRLFSDREAGIQWVSEVAANP